MNLTSAKFKADPYPYYAKLRAEKPVHRVRILFGIPAWIVARYDDVLTVLKDDRFSKEYVSKIPFTPRPIERMTRNLINIDPPAHTRLRGLVNKAFTPRVVERLREPVEKLCGDLLASRTEMDLVHDYALAVPLTVISDLLGIPNDDRRRFAKWSARVASADSGGILTMLRGWINMLRFSFYFGKLVDRRRSDPRDDLVSALIEAEEEGERLDRDELISMLGLLLFAGYETTVSLIAVGALTLMQNREQLDRFRSDADLVEPAIEELLRYTSPADFATPRVAREDVTLAGTTIPKGAMVIASLGSANRDETHFDDPDRLDLARTPNRHLAFGMGLHFCVGAPLARLEAQIALTNLFRRYPNVRPLQRADEFRWRKGMFFRGLEELPVTLGS